MTHDTRFSVRFQNNPRFLRAAVLYDFIPLDWPGYLETVPSRIEYWAKLARLRKFDLFFPISHYTAWRASELLGTSADRIHVTGASVRRSLYELRQRLDDSFLSYEKHEPYFLLVLAEDTRKNPEVAVKAVRHLNLLYGRRIALKVVGHYDVDPCYRANLLGIACHTEGAGFLEFCPDVPDEELVSLLAGAVAMIAPSHIEGFSLPVVEASVCGCPVIGSTCAAHLELIDHPEALFPSFDAALLCEKLDAVLNDSSLRDSLARSQDHLGAKFHERAVGKRFWGALEAAIENRSSLRVSNGRPRPRLAFLSPCPRDRSDIEGYTAIATAGRKDLCSDLYTDSARPLTVESVGLRDAGRISIAPLLNGSYNAIVSVLGNSDDYGSIFEIFERYGGPCILHDVRLTQIYFRRLGQEKFLSLASKLLGRSVSVEEVHRDWLQDRNSPSLLLEPVIERASPLIVDTPTQRALVKTYYGTDAHVITSCPTTIFDDAELTGSAQWIIRERHGIDPATFLVSSFGRIGRANGMDTCILAVELLRSWNIPAELFFIGDAEAEGKEAGRVAALYDIAEHVHCGTDFTGEAIKRDFLIASNAAVQVRGYEFGQLSIAVTDCISAGLPCVATNDMAISCDAPGYISTVPDRFSPLQVAEQLALIWESRSERSYHADLRAAYLRLHNPESYTKQLLEILEIA